jgi:hypothetical protein
MAKKWMQKAFGAHPGRLHRKLHVPEGEKIPAKKLSAARSKAEKTGDTTLKRELALAKTGKRFAGHRGSHRASR